MEISCSRFKQIQKPYAQNTTQCFGTFCNFLVIFRYIWEEIVFLKRVIKFGQIRNYSLIKFDVVLIKN